MCIRDSERPAELAELRPLAQRPAHRVHDPVERPADLPDLLDAERPHLRVLALEAEARDRGTCEMPLGALREHGDARGDVGALLEVAELLAASTATLVARADALHATVGDEEPLRVGLGQDRGARTLGLLGEEAAELG